MQPTNIPDIKELKLKEAVTLTPTKAPDNGLPLEAIADNNAVEVTINRFDQFTGEPLQPQTTTVKESEINQAITMLNAQLAKLQKDKDNLLEIKKELDKK